METTWEVKRMFAKGAFGAVFMVSSNNTKEKASPIAVKGKAFLCALIHTKVLYARADFTFTKFFQSRMTKMQNKARMNTSVFENSGLDGSRIQSTPLGVVCLTSYRPSLLCT